MQVSQLGGPQAAHVRQQADLGLFAREVGRGIPGQNWGIPGATKQGLCGRGRYGLATFRGGDYPAMLLAVTVSTDVVMMWTWLGPDPEAAEIDLAIGVILRERVQV